MKKILTLLLSSLILLNSMSLPVTATANVADNSQKVDKNTANKQPIDVRSLEYVEGLGYISLEDPNLLRYIKDVFYMDLVKQLNSADYFVEDVQIKYIPKEYIEELAYNSKENVYFGYKLSELDKVFQGKKYIFTLGENGQTEVKEFEGYDDTYDRVIKNVLIGSGVIILCVTISFVSAGAGAPAVAVIFAASAKTAAIGAVSTASLSGVSAAITEGIKTHDINKSLKAAALKASEGFKWGAITGAVAGGADKAIQLKSATSNGLTMNEVAQIEQEAGYSMDEIKNFKNMGEYHKMLNKGTKSGLTRPEVAKIQKESGYPLDVIRNFNNMEQYDKAKRLGLTPKIVDGKTALIRKIDCNYIGEGEKRTNLQRMLIGLAPLAVKGGKYVLHHLGQYDDSTLAILKESEHSKNGMNCLWHNCEKDFQSRINRDTFDRSVRPRFWQDYAKQMCL